nr:MADF domain containing protein [Haemonchus contortus]
MESFHRDPESSKPGNMEANSEKKEVSADWVEFDDFNYDDDIYSYGNSELSAAYIADRISHNKAFGYALRSELISLVKANRCLWDYTFDENRVSEAKARAWESIRAAMKSMGYDFQVRSLKKQWKSLKDTWRKMKQRTAADPGVRNQWAYTNQMRFLEAVEFTTPRHPNCVAFSRCTPIRNVGGNSGDSLKRKAPVADEDGSVRDRVEAKKSHMSPPRETHDQFSAFGQMVTEVLRSLPLEAAKTKMHIISTALFTTDGAVPSDGR